MIYDPGDKAELLARISEYAQRRKLKLQDWLGGGVQGMVYSTDSSSAVKVFKREEHFRQEVAVYRRIKTRKITSICGFAVPKPIGIHSRLMVIEMETVYPPFVVDFASAGVDAPLNVYPREVMAEWEAGRAEVFEDKWPLVRQIIAAFRMHGIYLSDVKPGNIVFE